MEIIQSALDSIDYKINIDSSIYYNSEGIIVPRVTDILSKTIHVDALMTWANRLGFRKLVYEEELNKAANIGSTAHSAIEEFLRNRILTDNVCFKGFKKWFDMISSKCVVEIVGIEDQLVCQYFGGTYDLLIRINGKVYLVDFKTSNYVGYKYFLQLSAYRYMLYYQKGINIDGCIILQLNKKYPNFSEYVLDFSIPEHYMFIESCIQCFLSLTYAYYNTKHIEEMFNNINFC